MPKISHNIVECVARVFHFNSAELFPKWIVIRSEHAKGFAITTIESFRLQQAAGGAGDWQIALYLASEDLLQIMEYVPPKSDEPDTCTTGVPFAHDPNLSPSLNKEVHDASGS